MRNLLPLWAAACTTTVPAPTILQEGPPVVLDRAEVASDAASCSPLVDGAWLVGADGGVYLDDPRAPARVPLGVPGREARGAAHVDGGLLVLTEQDLTWYDGLPWPSPLREELGEVPQVWRTDANGAWWLRLSTGWTRWTKEGQRTPSIEGNPVLGPIAPAGQIAGTPVEVLSDGTHIVLFGDGGAAHPGITLDQVRSVAIDGGGVVWAADGVRLWRYRPQDGWTAWIFPEGVAQVLAHPRRPEVYVRTTTAGWFSEGAWFRPIQGAPVGPWSWVDEAGRLVLQEPTACVAYGTSRGLAWLDVPTADIEARHVLTLSPSAADQVSSVSAQLGSLDLQISDSRPWQVTLDPGEHPEGEHRLTATVTWADGVTASTEVVVRLAETQITWADDVFPLFQTRCSACHGGASETVLEDPSAWTERWDRILELVTTRQMPLGQDPLNAEEIALLEAWADAGFP
jgi:mono/diheme cytochrome c family protein